MVQRNWLFGGSIIKWKTLVDRGWKYCSGNYCGWFRGGIVKDSRSVSKARRVLGVPFVIDATHPSRDIAIVPYKLLSLQKLQPGDTAKKKSFAECSMIRIESNSQWLFSVSYTNGTHFALHRYVNTKNTCGWVISNPCEYTMESHHPVTLSVFGVVSSHFSLPDQFLSSTMSHIGLKSVHKNPWALFHAFAWQSHPALNQWSALSIRSFM